MRHMRVLICQVDDSTPDRMTALACVDLPTSEVDDLAPQDGLKM